MKEIIKDLIKRSMKDKDNLKRDILKLVLGEIQSKESRTGKNLNDDKIESIIRKLIESNLEILSHKYDVVLSRENEILGNLLPTVMTTEEIEEALKDVSEDIKTANNDGQAMGIAMKTMKSCSGKALGQDVKEVVSDLRCTNDGS